MFVWCELVCDECAKTTAGEFVTGAIPRRKMKQRAADSGWIFKKSSMYCSKDCSKARDEVEP